MGKKSPCLNCEKRHTGCHANCEDYKNYRINLDEINKKRLEAKPVTMGYRPSKHKFRF